MAFCVTLCLAPITILALRRLGVVDVPVGRSSHTRPTLRGGGIAPLIGVLAGLAISELETKYFLSLTFITIAGGLLGLVEDVRGIPPKERLALQLLISGAVLPLLLTGFEGSTWWMILFGIGTLLWLCAYMNAFNFMDGINGISAAQIIVACVAWFAAGRLTNTPDLATSGLIAAAATLAFAPFNFPRARTFLGDVGSYFLGGYLAIELVLGLRDGIPFEAMTAPLALYLVDTATTLLRRVRRGDIWHEAHRDHTYQLLVRAGWSHTKTTLFVALLITLCSFLGLASLHESLPLRVACDVALASLLLLYLATPRLCTKEDRLVPSPPPA